MIEEELRIRITPSGLELIEENEIKVRISPSWLEENRVDLILNFVRNWILDKIEKQ